MTDARIAGLFPGQGSQAVGMGSDFAEHSLRTKELLHEADQLLGFSLSELALRGPLEELTLTQNAQPAILTVSYASYLEGGIPLSAAAGHSLGEYTALVAAGVLSFADAVQLVHKRGRYMQEAVPAGKGAMLAVLGSDEEELQSLIESLETGITEIANLNSPGQTVVAGDKEGIDSFAAVLKDKNIKFIPLNVSAPFHCRLMEPAAQALAKDLDATTFNNPAFPVYANFTAKAIAGGSDARELLKQQVCGTVRWTASMQHLVQEQKITHCVEFGPGGVLTKLMKRIDAAPARLEVFDRASLEKTLAALQQAD